MGNPAINYTGAAGLTATEHRLDNGLRLVLSEDHLNPVVAVCLWYEVGSRYEVQGRTGLAHLFEHLMFQGSAQVKGNGHFELVQSAGGSLNGTTSFERTNYFETMPAHQLELALWLEADRMGSLLAALDEESLQNQRDVVKNERRQRTENRPAGLISKVLLEALYPPAHPYYHEVIGSMEDLTAASVEDVQAFFRTFYAPGNATLVIAGDFDRAKTKELVEQYFGPIPAGGPVPRRSTPEVKLSPAKRIAMEAKVQQPQLYVAYPSPASFAPGDRELDLLANVLANGKSSRLYKRLVYDMKIAQSVSASQQSQLLGSDFEIMASPMPGHSLDEILAVIDQEIAAIQDKPVDEAELERAKNQIESDTVRSLEGLHARAERLQVYNLSLGDPGFLAEDLKRYRAVDAAALSRVAREVLRKDGRVVVTIAPNPEAPIMGRVVSK